MRILYTTPILEYPAAGGPQLRVANSIKALARICELDIIHRITDDFLLAEVTKGYFSKYSAEYHLIKPTQRVAKCNQIHLLVKRILNRIFDTNTEILANYIISHAVRRNIDVIWFGYGNISYQLIKKIKAKRPELKVVYDTDSVWSRFILREVPYIKGLRKVKILYAGWKKKREEKLLTNLCEVTTAVSEIDAEYYKNIAKNPNKVFLFSNVIDVDNYINRPPAPLKFKTPSIYLAGTFGHHHSPMDMAARWVIEEVLPKLYEVEPEVHFYIVGRNSEIGFGKFNRHNITVTGRLDTVLPYLCNADVSLVPLKFESGTRFKILEAGACSVPLVSTSLGAEGIPVIDRKHLLIADTPVDFANAIIALLKDKKLATELANNCRNLVVDFYSIDALTVEGELILNYLTSK